MNFFIEPTQAETDALSTLSTVITFIPLGLGTRLEYSTIADSEQPN
jgi:hypothetical protein